MYAQVKPWGNSQGIRLTKEILQAAGIATNETLSVEASAGAITLSKTHRRKTLEERAQRFGGDLGLGPEYDWGERTGSEVW